MSNESKRKLPDYELKAKVIELDATTDILKLRSKFDYLLYCYAYGLLDAQLPFSHEGATGIEKYFLANFHDEWIEAEKICHSHYQRTKRLRIKMEYLLTHYKCAFLTLTFNDEFLQRTSASTRRQYISRFLNSLECYYIGNLDFGKQNGREHYHAVVACVPTHEQLSEYSAGFYKVVPVRDTSNDQVRLAKYISKLTNHAIKETTKRSALLYSRKYKIPV